MVVEEPAADGRTWAVNAPVLERPGRPPMACAALQLSRPPQGGNIVVRGIEPRNVAGAEVFDDGTVLTPALHLTGVLDNGELVLTEPPSPAPVPHRRRPVSPTACNDPDGDAFSHAQRQAAVAYANAQTDLGEIWLSQGERVLNVSFTSDLARHRQAIRRVYPGPLCVVEASVSRLDLIDALRRARNDPYLAAHHVEVISSGLEHPIGGPAHVTVTVATPEQLAYLNGRHGPRVGFRSWLHPIQP
jgi:hypothetical protein